MEKLQNPLQVTLTRVALGDESKIHVDYHNENGSLVVTFGNMVEVVLPEHTRKQNINALDSMASVFDMDAQELELLRICNN